MKDFPTVETVPEYLRDGHLRHLGAVLDEEPPWTLRKLIPILSSNVSTDPDVVDRIRELAKKGPIIYAMKYIGIYDLHYLRMRFAQLGLPPPSFVLGPSLAVSGSLTKIFKVWQAKLARLFGGRAKLDGSDKDFYGEILKHGGAGVMFLVDEKTFRDRYVLPDRDPVRILLDIQGSFAGSISVVPIFILYDRTPRRTIRPFWESFLGDPDRPGLLKRILIATRRWSVPELLVGEPVHLVGEFEEFGAERSWEELPFELRKELIANINARIRVSRGPEKLSKTEIKERVLRDEHVRREVWELADGEKASAEKIRKKAEAYVEEIAGDPHLQVYHFLYHVLNWMFSHVFDGVDVKDEQFTRLKEVGRKGSLIFVPCHKSHFDYLLVGFLAFVNQIAVPHIAAGKNLSFWPIGPLFRNAGVFFMRRSFKGLELYTRVFAAYVKTLVREGFNMKFYLEGGRSRTGKFLPPRTGMLSFVVQAARDGAVEDLNFIPTFVGYDQIPEEKSYLRELSGVDKKKESLFAVLRAREVLKRRYGKVYVRFHDSLSFRAFCQEWRGGVDPAELSPEENRELISDFGYHLMFGIVRAGVVTPTDVAAAALTCGERNRVSHYGFMEAANCITEVLRAEGVEFAESLEDLETALQAAIGVFNLRGFVEIDRPDEDFGDKVYVIQDQARINLDFYRNGLVNYLWPTSLLSIILMEPSLFATEMTPAIREEFVSLRQLLNKELIADPLKRDETILENTFAMIRRMGWVRPPVEIEDRNEDLNPPACFRGLLADLLGAYYRVLLALEEVTGPVGSKEFARTIMKKATTADDDEEAHAGPPISSVTIRQALSRFSEMGILDYSASKRLINGVIDSAEKDRWKDRLIRLLGPRKPVSGKQSS